MDVTVAVATYGGSEWYDLAHSRAIPSAQDQARVVYAHADTLHDARNAALASVRTGWVIHLDADDELSPGYIDAMSRGTADVRGPMAQFVQDGRRRRMWQPRVHNHDHDCVAECITSGAGNWLLIGAAVRTELVRRVGGWRDWPCYEDFDLWMRVLLTGASVELVREAIYIAHVNPNSRNRGPAIAHKNRVHHDIVESVLGPVAA